MRCWFPGGFGWAWVRRNPGRALLVAGAVAVGITLAAVTHAPAAGRVGSSSLTPGKSAADGWWDTGRVLEVDVRLSSDALERLRRHPRDDVPAVLRIHGGRPRSAWVHLKGSGSFRSVDDRPSMTVTWCGAGRGGGEGGVPKFHLNNSVEDPSLLSEALGTVLFAAEGIPAPRVAHGRVRLNGRALGLYVVKEGFTDAFLRRHFGRADGSLFEPVRGAEVDGAMAPRAGPRGAVEETSVGALAAALKKDGPSERWAGIAASLDVERFVTFVALEVLLVHRDGYSLARNNFRLYGDPAGGRCQFLPHGMDQLFGPADLPWRPSMAGAVAKAMMAAPEGLDRYARRLRALAERWLASGAVMAQFEALRHRLDRDLTPHERRGLRAPWADLRRRVLARTEALHRPWDETATRVASPDFGEDGRAGVTDWRAVDAGSAARMETAVGADGRGELRILAGGATGATGASWRARVRLEPGRYRFRGNVRVSGVEPLPFGRGRGAGLRIVGADAPRAGVVGTAPWTPLGADFEVTGSAREIELVCELRARAGEAGFEAASLHLWRGPDS